jgi:hypothetical protein
MTVPTLIAAFRARYLTLAAEYSNALRIIPQKVCCVLALRVFAPSRLCVNYPFRVGRLTRRRKAAKRNRKVRH